MRVKAADLQIRSLLDLFQSLTSTVLSSLYSQSAVCLIVLRELSLEEQTVVMRLLFVDQSFSEAGINAWFTSVSGVDLSRLKRLKLFFDSKLSVTPTVIMNEDFRISLKSAVGGMGAPWDLPVLEPDPKIPQRSAANLTTYATERWEALLQFMVGSEGSREKLSDETIGILKSCGLIELDLTESSKPALTASGFQFLLQETSAQVWYFLSQYFLRLNARDPERLIEVMTFLLQMSQAVFGREYSSDNLSETVMNFVQFLRELGLVYMRKRRDGRFYPTNLAISFIKGSQASVSLGNQKDISQYFRENKRNKDGFIVVESNFRIYAYTDSDLHAALIAMFSTISYRFPGCICCVITRESIRESLLMGISADKILHYLLSHLHPQVNFQFSFLYLQLNYFGELVDIDFFLGRAICIHVRAVLI